MLSDTHENPVTGGIAGSVTGKPTTPGDTGPSEEIVKVLRPEDEESQNILKAMSNQNTLEIYQMLLSGGPMKLSDVADRFGMSMNATKYHIDNLEKAGLVEIAGTKYSRKGRKMNVYRSKSFVFLFAPNLTERSELLSVVMKYCAVLGVFIAVFTVTLVQPFVQLPNVPLSLAGSIHQGATLPVQALPGSGVIPALIIAGIVTLLMLVAFELKAFWIKSRLTS